VFFPSQLNRRDELLHAVTTFWEIHVRSKLEQTFDRYVVDFAVLRNGRVIVIELNPFDTYTGENTCASGPVCIVTTLIVSTSLITPAIKNTSRIAS
jgi:hypothetical protein